LQPVLIFSW